MDVLILRHAIAEDRLIFAASEANDDLRPLTGRGRRRMERGALGIRRLLPRIDTIGASPLVRAQETAAILARTYQNAAELIELPTLAPGVDPGETSRWLGTQPPGAVIALVGHEPDLSSLLAWLTTGRTEPFTHLRKAGAALVHFDSEPEAGTGSLEWLLTAKQLRLLGEGAPTP